MFDAELRELERRFEGSSAADDGERYLRALERAGAEWPEVARVRHALGRTHHERALALLGERPAFSPAAAAALQTRELALDLELPDSVREWFSLSGGAECLQRHSAACNVIAAERLGEVLPDVEDAAALRVESLLVFMVMDQGALRWAARLGPGADPEVWIQTRDLSPMAPEPGWEAFARSFSEFVAAQLFDQRPRRLGVAFEGPALPAGALSGLARTLEPWPSTEVGAGEHQYRFGSRSERVAVRCAANRSWWQLSASSETVLGEAWRLLRDACGSGYEPTAAQPWDPRSEAAWSRILARGDEPAPGVVAEGPA